MNSEERRKELNNARVLAVAWSNKALLAWTEGRNNAHEYIDLANMYSRLAQALKVGDPIADHPVD